MDRIKGFGLRIDIFAVHLSIKPYYCGDLLSYSSQIGDFLIQLLLILCLVAAKKYFLPTEHHDRPAIGFHVQLLKHFDQRPCTCSVHWFCEYPEQNGFENVLPCGSNYSTDSEKGKLH